VQHRQQLPRSVDASGQARRLVTTWAGDALDPEELDRAKLVVSELINNAVLHGEGSIELQLDLDEHRLQIEVIDEGGGFEHVMREVPFEDLSGRGLAIVEAVTSRWGIHEGTTHVWAEFERPGPPGTHLWAELERPGPRIGEDAKPEE
jgi:anti-sigma regulatory factor (Ser/Thr protein kinase)